MRCMGRRERLIKLPELWVNAVAIHAGGLQFAGRGEWNQGGRLAWGPISFSAKGPRPGIGRDFTPSVLYPRPRGKGEKLVWLDEVDNAAIVRHMLRGYFEE